MKLLTIFAKGTSKIMHQLVWLKAENKLSKRRRAKKARLQQGGSLSQQEAQELQDETDIAQQVKQETQAWGGRKPNGGNTCATL
jgi:hypothetical protein